MQQEILRFLRVSRDFALGLCYNKIMVDYGTMPPRPPKALITFISAVATLMCLSGCSSVDYVSNRDLQSPQYRAMTGASNPDADAPYWVKLPKQFGALAVGESKDNAASPAALMLLKRKDSTYYAETLLHQSEDRKKRYFFSSGVDVNTKRTGINFRIEF